MISQRCPPTWAPIVPNSIPVVQVVLAWAFVASRFGHSYLHVVVRRVPPRFLAFVGGVAILSAMWIGFFADMVAAALAYHHQLAVIGTQL